MDGLIIPANTEVSIFYEKVEPFEDASFYEPETIAMVEHGDRRVLVDVSGDLRMYDLITGDEQKWTSDRLRSKYPDGNLDELSGKYDIQDNRWYELFFEQGGDSWCVDEAFHSYTEALQAAIDYATGDAKTGVSAQ